MAKTSSGNGTDTPVRILLVDDFQPFRSFVLSLLSKAPELEVICEVSDGLEAVHKAEELQPDLILLDVNLPKLNGIEAVSKIQRVAPNSAILFLSECSDLDVVHAALAAGGKGYLLKSAMSRDLVEAIQTVLEGKPFLSHGLISQDDWG